jgi:hypothetical protein
MQELFPVFTGVFFFFFFFFWDVEVELYKVFYSSKKEMLLLLLLTKTSFAKHSAASCRSSIYVPDEMHSLLVYA